MNILAHTRHTWIKFEDSNEKNLIYLWETHWKGVSCFVVITVKGSIVS
jgi:hypothetical protein